MVEGGPRGVTVLPAVSAWGLHLRRNWRGQGLDCAAMMRRLLILAVGTLTVVGALAAPALAAEITLTDDGFDPQTVEAALDETIVWSNDTDEEVTIVGEDGSWDSGALAPGETFSLSLSEPGEYPYRTSAGAGDGVVIVAAAQDAEDPTEQPTDPDAPPPPVADEDTLPATGQASMPAALLALVLVGGGTVLVRATQPV